MTSTLPAHPGSCVPASAVGEAGGLRVRGLTVAYRQVPVLRDVSLDAPTAGICGVIGPNGAGKSTLLKAVLGLVRADAGSVTVGGRPVGAVRASIAYLPQRSAIDWDYPAQVREVVAMGRYPHRGVLRRQRARDRELVDAALERVGLSDYRNHQVGELSGGQQQRAFLGRALAQEASVLLLDEPFTGVDAPTITLLSGLLRQLAESGACVVVVNHDLSSIGALCDRLVLLNRSVVAAGPPDEVLTPGALALAYGEAPQPFLLRTER